MFLIVASLGFWGAALVGVRGQARAGGTVTVMRLGLCSISVDAGLKQVEAPMVTRQLHTAAVVAMAIAAVWQYRRRREGRGRARRRGRGGRCPGR